MRSYAAWLKLFSPGGRGLQGSRPAHACGRGRMCMRPKLPLSAPGADLQSPALLPAFRHGLTAVAGMAEALQVPPVREHRPVPVVRLHMIHVRGPGAVPGISGRIPSGALPAERLPQELGGPQVIRPFRGGIHPPPGLGRLAAPSAVFRLVGRAVSVRDQDAASRVPARPQGLLCHRAITSGQNKRAWADTSALRIMWLRLIGSGSNRCSKIAPACNNGNRHRPELCRPVGAGGASLSRIRGR